MDPTASHLSPSEQVLIRRERRQAKVKSSAGARLNRITSTQGQTFRNENETPEPTPDPTPSRSEPTPDPPDVDISTHHYEPKSRQQDRQATENIFASMMGGPSPPGGHGPGGGDLHQPSDMDLQQLLLSMNRGAPPSGMPGMGMPDMGASGDDPMLAMLQQMMSTGGGMPGMGPGMQVPPGMAMPPGMEGLAGMLGMQDPATAGKDWGGWWRALHALCTFVLGLWAVKATGWSFSGSLAQRLESASMAVGEKPLFWYFTTMELVLQSSRFFLEKGRPPPGSWLSTIGGFLPRPFSTILTTIARYSVIWTTIMADAGVLLFCLGVFAWWNT